MLGIYETEYSTEYDEIKQRNKGEKEYIDAGDCDVYDLEKLLRDVTIGRLNIFIDDSEYLPSLIDDKFINFRFIENENDISIFFSQKNYNLIGWQTVDVYQNLSMTYLSSIFKNTEIDKNIFNLPQQN